MQPVDKLIPPLYSRVEVHGLSIPSGALAEIGMQDARVERSVDIEISELGKWR